MIIKRLVSASLVAGLLAACASTDNAPEPAKLTQITDYAQAKVVWHQDIGNAEDFVFRPAIDSDKVFVAERAGRVTVFDLKTGKQLASWKTSGPLSAGVAAAQGVVAVASEKGQLYLYDDTGALRWQTPAGTEVVATPVIAGDAVVVHASNGDVAAFSIEDGKRRWIFQRAIPALTLRNTAPVAASGSILYAGLPAGKLVALRRDDGNVLWDAVVAQPKGATELERISDVTSVPVIDSDVVCAVAFQGKVTCFDASNGNPGWSRDVSSSVGLAADGTKVYVTDDTGSVLAYEKRSGRNLWKQAKLFARDVSAPAVIGRFVIVGDLEGYVHFLSAEDGSFLTRIKTDGSAIRTAPVVVGDQVIVQTERGGIFALFAN
ncbi:outer membrane protein assembly factor BamB [Chitinivorax tropicus]|uniref:Outer membrane protein assembly factor BamB n=1 Tax=Chitinivorax tropicus TaxID=714531 RepID=A0A840MTU0_9PROT|nr:outer membrane protein assembly factor BamB [Chitinivorax tropicus]